MPNLLLPLDRLLNRFTMYKIVLYGLLGLLVVSVILGFSGVIVIAPVGLLISVLILGASCYAANAVFGWLWHAPRNHESYMITAAILACILPPAHTVAHGALLALAGVIAMAAKYVLVYRGSHVLNPAATAAFVLSVTGLLPATWWIATPWLTPFTVLLALVVLRKQRKFQLFAVFAAASVIILVYVGLLHQQAFGSIVRDAVLSWPIIFLGSIMLTEPITLATRHYYQLLTAVLVGVLFACQLRLGPVTATPQAALLAGNIFTLLAAPTLGAMLRLKAIKPLTADSYELAFEPIGRPLSFIPGQYAEWTLPHHRPDWRGNRRSFSIVSAPTEPEIRIGIKTYQPSSSFKHALLALKPGQLIRAAHPAGNFTLPANPKTPLLFIAGGIGITPFCSMLQHLLAVGERRDIVLLYSARSQDDFAFKDLLDAASATGLNTMYSTERLTAETIRSAVPDLENRTVYISGPDAMVTNYKRLLQASGLKTSNIKTDHFSGY